MEENPVRVQKEKNCSDSVWLWATVLMKDFQWIFCLAMDLEKRPSFYRMAPLWCVLIQESNSLKESEDQRFNCMFLSCHVRVSE